MTPATINAAALVSSAKVETIAAKTVTFNGAAFDTVDYEGPLRLVLQLGAVSGTSPTLDLKVQSSETSGGTYADISGATFAQKAAAQADSVDAITIDLNGCKRFIRVVGTIAGTSPSFTLGVTGVGIKKYS